MTATTKTLSVGKITVEPELQMRIRLSPPIVKEYKEDMARGDSFPPVVVFQIEEDKFLLVDGFHRIEALKILGIKKVRAEVHTGTEREAKLFAVSVNNTHGVRRTNEDKRKAVLTLLNDEEWSKWSDREIAKQCGVSNTFVSNLHNELKKEQGKQEDVQEEVKEVEEDEEEKIEGGPETFVVSRFDQCSQCQKLKDSILSFLGGTATMEQLRQIVMEHAPS